MGMQGLTAKGPPAGLPKFLLFIRIAIIVLSVIILGLAAYAISIIGSYVYGSYYGTYYGTYYNGASGLLIFTVIKTWIIYGAFTFIEMKAPRLFFRIIAIVLYALSVIFWLSAWAYAASSAASWLVGSYVGSPSQREGAALAACAGLGALIWILSIVHLVFLVKACLSDGSAGVHSQAELGQMGGPKVETGYPTTTPTPVQYGQQPTPYGQPQAAPYGQPQQQPYGAPQQQPYPAQ